MQFRSAPTFFADKRLEITWQNGTYVFITSIWTSEKHPRFRGQTTCNESINAYFQHLCTSENLPPRFSRTKDSKLPGRMGYISLVWVYALQKSTRVFAEKRLAMRAWMLIFSTYALAKCTHVFRGRTTRDHLAEWDIFHWYEYMHLRKAPALSRRNDLH